MILSRGALMFRSAPQKRWLLHSQEAPQFLCHSLSLTPLLALLALQSRLYHKGRGILSKSARLFSGRGVLRVTLSRSATGRLLRLTLSTAEARHPPATREPKVGTARVPGDNDWQRSSWCASGAHLLVFALSIDIGPGPGAIPWLDKTGNERYHG